MVAQLLIQVDVGLCTQVALLWLWKLVVEEALYHTCIVAFAMSGSI